MADKFIEQNSITKMREESGLGVDDIITLIEKNIIL